MSLNRRRFLSLFGLGAAAVAVDQVVPLGRVWSFPSKIVIPPAPLFGIDFAWDDYEAAIRAAYLEPAALQLAQEIDLRAREFAYAYPIGSTINIRLPQRWYVRDSYVIPIP